MKGKIGKKLIKNRVNIHESQKRWQFVIIFLQLNFFPFFQVESIPFPQGSAFGQNIHPFVNYLNIQC